jgi:hypothetical protein
MATKFSTLTAEALEARIDEMSELLERDKNDAAAVREMTLLLTELEDRRIRACYGYGQ